MKRQVVSHSADLAALECRIVAAVDQTVIALRKVLADGDSLSLFARLKFAAAGCDPLDLERPLNLVEQLNQTFTYLASILGAGWLSQRYPECLPLQLNLGTASGFDIESQCGNYVAETFAATHPGSNGKLHKDISRLETSQAVHRFVFYLSPVEAAVTPSSGITVIRLRHPSLDVIAGDA